MIPEYSLSSCGLSFFPTISSTPLVLVTASLLSTAFTRYPPTLEHTIRDEHKASEAKNGAGLSFPLPTHAGLAHAHWRQRGGGQDTISYFVELNAAKPIQQTVSTQLGRVSVIKKNLSSSKK